MESWAGVDVLSDVEVLRPKYPRKNRIALRMIVIPPVIAAHIGKRCHDHNSRNFQRPRQLARPIRTGNSTTPHALDTHVDGVALGESGRDPKPNAYWRSL